MKLLSELVSQDAWKSSGVSITRLVHRIEMNLPSRKKRKNGEPEPAVEKPKGEDVYEEIIHLPPEAGYELIELLKSKKQLITQMAEQEKKRAQEALGRVYDFLFELSHKHEMKEFDFKTRSLEWQRDDDTRMTCRYQAAEGRIWLAEDKLFWNTCVKREGNVGNSHHFVKFVEAVDWVEKEIVHLVSSPIASWSRASPGSGLRIRAGGGVRSLADVEALLAAGASRVVVGSAAVREREMVAGWVGRLGADAICVALDARPLDGGGWRLPVAGWTEDSGAGLHETLDWYVGACALRHVLCTDISRDGMYAGPSLALYRELAVRHPSVELQGSGGVRDAGDVRALREAGVAGAVVGKALLEGRATLEELLRC